MGYAKPGYVLSICQSYRSGTAKHYANEKDIRATVPSKHSMRNNSDGNIKCDKRRVDSRR